MKLPFASPDAKGGSKPRDELALRKAPPEEPRQALRPRAAPTPVEEARWQAVKDALRPRLLLRVAEEFVRDFPASEYLQTAQLSISGARRALAGQRAAGLTSDALEDKGGNAAYRDELKRALRGDKDSAYRIALMYRDGTNGLRKAARRVEQWLRYAAELGSGTASWQVSQIYSRRGQQADAARYERRAVELGYRIPPRLSNRGY